MKQEILHSEEAMKAFGELFDKVYDCLYITAGPFVDYGRAVDTYDQKMEADAKFKQAAQAFMQYRQDMITSDREAAAFVIAYLLIDCEGGLC